MDPNVVDLHLDLSTTRHLNTKGSSITTMSTGDDTEESYMLATFFSLPCCNRGRKARVTQCTPRTFVKRLS